MGSAFLHGPSLALRAFGADKVRRTFVRARPTPMGRRGPCVLCAEKLPGTVAAERKNAPLARLLFPFRLGVGTEFAGFGGIYLTGFGCFLES